MSRICILGASGLIGATLVERLMQEGVHEIVPVINSAGSAWRLTRYGIPLVQANLGDADAVDKAIAGSDIVVNCARLSENMILAATSNLIETCKRHKVDRLIHLSSVAVYGESPKPESVTEDAPVNADKGMFLLSGLGTRSFALVDEGNQPVMLCDVHNICHAIELAFTTEHLDGSRTYIMDGESTTWKQYAETLAQLVGHEVPLPSLSPQQARDILEKGPKGIRGAMGTARQLAQLPGVKKTIKRNANLTRALIKWRSRVTHLPAGIQARVNRMISGGGKSKGPALQRVTRAPTDIRFLRHQLRGVSHSIAKAERTLGYKPEVSFEESMQAFALWYQTMHGHAGPSASMLAELDEQAWQQ